MIDHQTFELEPVVTEDGSITMTHMGFGEDFHSKLGAQTEAFELYLRASGFIDDLAAKQKSRHVLDVGLGLGYNAVATIECWMKAASPGPLKVTSLELHRELLTQLQAADAPWMVHWPENWLRIAKAGGRLEHPSSGDSCEWNFLIGDASQMRLTELIESDVTYIWQDAFSPQKCPQLWTENWFATLRSLSHPDVTLVTYSVARQVRDHLTASGWLPQKIPACGAKKSWLRAKLAKV